jgi:hypothetical protein
MSIEVQIRRGTNAENAAFTGQEGELVYTTDTKDLYVHDGTTAGGTVVGSLVGIPDDSITFAKIEEIPANTILGNNTGGSSDIIELSVAQTQALLNVADGANNYSHPNHTGEVTSTGDGATVIANGVVDSDNLSTTLDFGSIA